MAAPPPKSDPQPSPMKLNRTVHEESFELKEEKELMEQANNYLQNNLRSNSSHLVKPKRNR